ncbi:MAG TPA: alpha/beta hydrolase [Conexibacter sp.]|nr:alpha/beta hydrolase [Conexibacter sp.]
MRRLRTGSAVLFAATALLLCVASSASAAPFRAEVRHADVRGERIAWYERGSGPPLLLAIGTGSTMAEWDPALLALLAREHRLILFDYPGLGRSSRRPAGVRTSFAGLADTTAGLLRAIGVARADVLGWSMGGFVAQQLAIRHPGSVRRLVLAGTNPGGDRAVLGPPADQRIDSDPDPSDAAVLRVLYPRTRAGQAEGRAFLARLERASEVGTIPDDFDVPAATVEGQVAAENPWLRSNANARALRRLRLPLLVTAGRADAVTPPLNARRIARLVPGARLAVLPGAHAFLFGERVRFARLLGRFLDIRP